MILGRDTLQEILQTLQRNRLRSVLTACGIFWGVMMLVVMLGFARGLEDAILRDFGNWAENSIYLWGGRTTRPHNGMQPGRRIQLTMDDVRIVENIRGVTLVAPRNQFGGRGGGGIVSRKGKTESFGVSGEMPENVLLESLSMERGRFLNPMDLAETRKVAVIGPGVAEVLFERREDPIGESIKIGNMDFTVVGVFKSPARGAAADWQNRRIFTPRTTFARINGTGNQIDGMAILVSSERSSAAIEEEIRSTLRRRHGVAPDDTGALGAYNRERDFQKMRGLFTGISMLGWVVGVLTLLAGAMGVSNIMMIAVAERTREIGVRKALGARPVTILAQVVAEATMLTGVAGYAGLVAGVGVLEIAGRVVDAMPAEGGIKMLSAPSLNFSVAIAAAAVLTAAGALSGLAPARKAVAIRPMEALAHE